MKEALFVSKLRICVFDIFCVVSKTLLFLAEAWFSFVCAILPGLVVLMLRFLCQIAVCNDVLQ
jgi:hypothetical protein